MKRAVLARYRFSVVWLLLLAMTAHGVWIMTLRCTGWSTGVAIVVLAFSKVYLIMLEFMELRRAPSPRRVACELWIVGIAVGIMLLYRF